MVEIYGNVRAMFVTNITIRQLIINICHLFGVFMVKKSKISFSFHIQNTISNEN